MASASGTSAGARSPERPQGGLGIPVHVEPEAGQQRARRGGHVPAGAALGQRLEQRCQLQQRVVAQARHRRVPGDPVGAEREAVYALLADAHRVGALVAERQQLAAALVEQVVAAHQVRVLGAHVRGAGAAHLLVGHGDHEQVPARRAPALVGQRAGRHHLGCGLALHVERAAAPYVPVGERARPGAVLPAGGVGPHGVHVREQPQHRARRLAAQAGHQVRPLGVLAHRRKLEAGRAQRHADQLLRRALVAGRVDRVDAQQALEQGHRLVGAAHARNRPA